MLDLNRTDLKLRHVCDRKNGDWVLQVLSDGVHHAIDAIDILTLEQLVFHQVEDGE